MKYFLAIIMGLAVFLLGAGGSEDKYWFCYQMGSTKSGNILAVSGVSADDYPDNYSERERQFEIRVQEQFNDEFRSQFAPRCVCEDSAERSTKKRQSIINRAEEKDYDIQPIYFKYKE